ncbi:cupin domain-containing protein [Mesorhizobium sp. M2A.F.Ca.ET.037.01.1.1]|uniref:cupin domain-containing protein n=1 Tax=unclassified Mesorhizobium TaxID=325217 RepID=UPI000F7606F7|nr:MULTISPECIES: cupin domain-containing protein [unclassified Mesorhizobium]RUX88325.1 cupin domain-containing protein [Mesorhizobium sp. M2A.F.Ca.ET.040.01.1.1]RVC58719.1 cupin domain-containing protein [Mesorhizobium sp. M2A.F.Ca.ET.046.02.1.1]RVC62687.1 cupin domain-containing protein [Mesorhizobium sp. M00.F.Ca.ET.038.03.1.1]AZO38489.1 cupin domain-containing protein [Mesorhizobium sp. M2A.F.Ca.ET.046.03.2.1]RUX14515.1 cupin domain-containing protein [Mesorhizobium sp. M2A.F.Ca.ET.037.01.
MSDFQKAVISTPGSERLAKAPHGAKVVVHATAAETNGAFGMWETFTLPGKGPTPSHSHARDRGFLGWFAGLIVFQCGDEEFDAPPGTVVVLPPYVRHSWRNIGDEPGQMFAIVTPGGFEQLFMEIEASGAASPDEIAMIEARLGIINDETLALDR